MVGHEIFSTLKDSDLHKSLNPEELEMLYIHNQIVDFFAGEIILKQGKDSKGIYLIINGTVTITAKVLGEGSTKLELLGPGNFLGEVSYIENIPCATSAVANENVQCLFISKTYLEMLSAYHLETKYKLFSVISRQVFERLKKMHDKIADIISNSEMTTLSFFGEIIHSLTKPTKISFAESQFNMDELRQYTSFALFTKNEIEELFQHGVLLKAAKNCTLIYKGEKSPSCYIVIHGAVQSSVVKDNKAAKLSVIGPGTLFASVACIDNDPSFIITFATCEKAILFKLAEPDLLYFQKNNPILWYKIFSLICRSLVALEKSVDKLDIRLNIEIYNR